jgi:hypothetical protein
LVKGHPERRNVVRLCLAAERRKKSPADSTSAFGAYHSVASFHVAVAMEDHSSVV